MRKRLLFVFVMVLAVVCLASSAIQAEDIKPLVTLLYTANTFGKIHPCPT